MIQTIGLISDTHGLLRPEAIEALAGVELIIHAGDIGGAAIVSRLREIAPVHAVVGNTDSPRSFPASVEVAFGDVRIHVSHGHELGSPTPDRLISRYDTDIIVYGHTHKPLVQRIGRQLIVNPGAAGPRRFNLQPSVARLVLPSQDVTIVHL